MNLTDALKVVDLIDKYTGAEGQAFPTEQNIMGALFTLRDTLLASASLVTDANGQVRATPASERAIANARRDLPADQVEVARRQRELPTDVQMAINAQMKDCGTFLKPLLVKGTPQDAHAVFNGLLDALVSIAEVGVTGRRDPRIVLPKDCH